VFQFYRKKYHKNIERQMSLVDMIFNRIPKVFWENMAKTYMQEICDSIINSVEPTDECSNRHAKTEILNVFIRFIESNFTLNTGELSTIFKEDFTEILLNTSKTSLLRFYENEYISLLTFDKIMRTDEQLSDKGKIIINVLDRTLKKIIEDPEIEKTTSSDKADKMMELIKSALKVDEKDKNTYNYVSEPEAPYQLPQSAYNYGGSNTKSLRGGDNNIQLPINGSTANQPSNAPNLAEAIGNAVIAAMNNVNSSNMNPLLNATNFVEAIGNAAIAAMKNVNSIEPAQNKSDGSNKSGMSDKSGTQNIQSNLPNMTGNPGITGTQNIQSNLPNMTGNPSIPGIQNIQSNLQNMTGNPGIPGIQNIQSNLQNMTGNPGIPGIQTPPKLPTIPGMQNMNMDVDKLKGQADQLKGEAMNKLNEAKDKATAAIGKMANNIGLDKLTTSIPTPENVASKIVEELNNNFSKKDQKGYTEIKNDIYKNLLYAVDVHLTGPEFRQILKKHIDPFLSSAIEEMIDNGVTTIMVIIHLIANTPTIRNLVKNALTEVFESDTILKKYNSGNTLTNNAETYMIERYSFLNSVMQRISPELQKLLINSNPLNELYLSMETLEYDTEVIRQKQANDYKGTLCSKYTFNPSNEANVNYNGGKGLESNSKNKTAKKNINVHLKGKKTRYHR
jgi:hypothetical protein